MRIHSNTIGYTQTFRDAVKHLPGVRVSVEHRGSRSHQYAFEVRLTGTSNRRPNSGKYGADTTAFAATWDEWGAFIAAIYAVDPDAVWGQVKAPNYRNRAHFDAVTRYRFDADGLPSDTHQDHRWERIGGVNQCTKCSASWERIA